jgi:hypothetical protein
MNSGLPTLLDAIFGKQNLDSVSIDEIYELINEFPSFNAGHFLLSKKLKEQSEADYEKETMRTALYFNNPFWLESVLNEKNHLESGKINPTNFKEPGEYFPMRNSFSEDSGTEISEIIAQEFIPEPEPLFFDQLSPVQPDESTQSLQEDTHIEKITELQQSFQEQPQPEYVEGPVRSFDDLISKYHITPLTTPEENVGESPTSIPEQAIENTQSEEKTDFQSAGSQVVDEQPAERLSEADSGHFISEEIADDYEIREEVVNEYGIFEEVKVKKTDFDLEAFDRPVTNIPEGNENASDDNLLFKEIQEVSNERNDEGTSPDSSDKEQIREDYEAFDRPIDSRVQQETESPLDLISEEESISEIYSGQENRLESIESHLEADDTGTNEITSQELDAGKGQMPELADRYGEQQKIMTPFDPKKAESIVFAPYHMIDYFASQGIKLVLEENPSDPFAKQLKSFTDWLKVMKKLPAQSISDKADEKEVDRIRHFAAHSIDEREILTESMAEVLAKQGMYENAIALFQKLSLIYPPKSAYFASRIEQLKASLP